MLFQDPITLGDVSKHVNENVSQLSKVIWQAVGAAVALGVPSAFKWAQDHSFARRRVALTERIAALAKSIADLPPEPESTAQVVTGTALETSIGTATPIVPSLSPRSALTAEMGAVLRELATLQAKAPHRLSGLAGAATSARAMLLLYKPKGWVAWMLHIAFFCYMGVLVFCFIAVMTDTSASVIASKNSSEFFSNLVAFIFLACVALLPALILRYFAAKIHRKQCAQAQAASAPQATTVPGAVQA
jgi:hypothetical protein